MEKAVDTSFDTLVSAKLSLIEALTVYAANVLNTPQLPIKDIEAAISAASVANTAIQEMLDMEM